MRRTRGLALAAAVAASAIAAGASQTTPARPAAPPATPAPRKPNIVLVLADDLGYGEIGPFGQTKIRTPSLDRLAREGIRFTQHYSGSPVCAPSRAVLLTGLHTGHAYIRDNDEMEARGDVWHDPALEGQRPLLAGTTTIATVLKRAGYATAAVGKWGLGGPGSTGEPTRQGFDFFFGFLCQRWAHNHYPAWLWRNTTRVPIEGNPPFDAHQKLPEGRDPLDPASYREYSGRQYALDLMAAEAQAFIRAHRDRPFFLYFAPTVPHAALQVPEDSLKEYEGAFPETPYTGDKGYLPHRAPRAAYAAMVTRLDRIVGELVALIQELGLDRDTLLVFTSDNGPTFNGGTDSEFFRSAFPFSGLKATLYEGGIHVPMIARWPGRVPAGATSEHVSAFEDYLPTFAALTGARLPAGLDGVSMVAALEGRDSAQRPRDALYWEFQGKQAVRMGRWKAIRDVASDKVKLYDLVADVYEQANVASSNPGVAMRARAAMKAAHVDSPLFPLVKKAQ